MKVDMQLNNEAKANQPTYMGMLFSWLDPDAYVFNQGFI